MKRLLFSALAVAAAIALTACGGKRGIVFDDGKTYEEVIAEPYTADQL